MYTLLINENNEIVTTVKERIMQRSKLVDNLHFLMNPSYKGIDMSDFTVTMEYILPVSREYTTETLVKSDVLYKGQLEYTLPFDTCLTKEAGRIDIQLTFTKVSLDADGNSKQQVRKAGPATITIVPVSAWSNIIPDGALSALDQRILMVDAMINAANEMNNYLYETKADNIVVNKETNTIQLTANGSPIGDAVEYSTCGIKSFNVDENDNITVTLIDGRVIDLGNIQGASGVVFTPHIDKDGILTWSNNGGLENPEPYDLNIHDEWSTVPEEGVESEYEWDYI
jgi:hypothetical protein